MAQTSTESKRHHGPPVSPGWVDWIISNLSGGERTYALPGRCSKCRSVDVVAEIKDGQVIESCDECGYYRTFRLIRTVQR